MKAVAVAAVSCVQRTPASAAFRGKRKPDFLFFFFLSVIELHMANFKENSYPKVHPETTVAEKIHKA